MRALLLDAADLYSGYDCPRIRTIGELPAFVEQERART